MVGNSTSNNNSYMTILREDNKNKGTYIVNSNNNLNPDKRTHKSRVSAKVEYTQTGGNIAAGVSNILRKDHSKD